MSIDRTATLDGTLPCPAVAADSRSEESAWGGASRALDPAGRDLISVNRLALRARRGDESTLKTTFPEALVAPPEEAGTVLRSERDLRRFVVSGGDGTLNHFLLDLLEADVPVGLLPRGTANDLAHEMGVASGLPVTRAESPVSVRRVDVVLVNQCPFTTVGFMGFGSDVVRLVNRWRTLSWTRPLLALVGKYVYVVGVLLRGMRRLPHYRLRLRSEDGARDVTVETPLVVIANQPKVGGTMALARGTRNDDGRFRVLVFPKSSGPGLLRKVASLCRGLDPASLGVASFETSRLHLSSLDRRPFLFCADGEELLDGYGELDVRIHPKQLQLIVSQ